MESFTWSSAVTFSDDCEEDKLSVWQKKSKHKQGIFNYTVRRQTLQLSHSFRLNAICNPPTPFRQAIVWHK